MMAYNNICNMMHKNAAHTYDAQKSSTNLGCSHLWCLTIILKMLQLSMSITNAANTYDAQ